MTLQRDDDVSGGYLGGDDPASVPAATATASATTPVPATTASAGLLGERPDVDVDAEPVLDLVDAAAALPDDVGDVALLDVDDGGVPALEVDVDLPAGDISYVIGKGGGRITDIEDRLGIDIDVRTFDEHPNNRPGASGGVGDRAGGGNGASGSPAGQIVTPEITSRHVIVPFEGHAGETVEVQAGGEYLFTATVSRGGEIQVSRGSAIAEELEDAIDGGRQITVAPQ